MTTKQKRIGTLLTAGDTNSKLRKSNKSGKGYLTAGLSLAPANTSGFEVCPNRSPGCTRACLFNSGYAYVFPSINKARIRKTKLFFKDRERFLARLVREIESWRRKARKQGLTLAVRLNVFSDIPWERISPELFRTFDDVQFYDYTKSPKRMLAFCEGRFPSNYHLTFSRSEVNEVNCLAILAAGGSVAVVFEDELPDTWHGYPVVNGDETDLRFLDPKSSVIGLYVKGVNGRKDDSGFVVRDGGKFSLPIAR